MKSFIDEFKKFAMRGNVIDMAVGIIIGAAFGKIVDSLVKDIMMPPIGLLLGKVDFSDLKLYLTHGENPVTVNYGLFINALISFLIVAFAVFILIKAINKLQERMVKEEAAAAPAAIGAFSENEKNFGKSLIFVGLAEGVCLYGLIISFMILGNL